MHIGPRIRLAVGGGMFLAVLACRGGGARTPAAAAGPPPEVLKPLQVPASPYYLIYSPPVSLAKPPDTAAHGRKPRS